MATAKGKAQFARFSQVPPGAAMTEDVQYRPYRGRVRTVAAIIERMGPEGYASGSAGRFQVTVLDDEIDGIAADQIDLSGDRIDVPEKRGDTTLVSRRIHAVVDQDDPDFLVMEVR